MEQCTSCYEIMRQRRHRDGKGAPLYLRQGGARLLTEVTTRKEGWGRMGGAQHRCGWLFVCGWNEERRVGERHGGVRGSDTDNTEKPGRTLGIRVVAAWANMFKCCFLCLGFFRQRILKRLVHPNDTQKSIFSQFLLMISSLDCSFGFSAWVHSFSPQKFFWIRTKKTEWIVYRHYRFTYGPSGLIISS